MTIKRTYNNVQGPYDYDDTTLIIDYDGKFTDIPYHALTTDGQLYVSGTPTLDNHVVRKADLDDTLNATSLLILIMSVDGNGSGLDADKLDGQHATYFTPLTSYTSLELLVNTHAELFGSINSLLTNYNVRIGNLETAEPAYGTSGNRPIDQAIGFFYYDTSLEIPIWYNGSVWKNSTGLTV